MKTNNPKSEKPRPKWRWLKRGAFAVVVLITLSAMLLVFENWRGRRAWATYQAALEAKGEVLDWRKRVPDDIPDNQNFAKTPLLAPLTEVRLAADGHTELVDPDAQSRLNDRFAWLNMLNGLGSWRRLETVDWAAKRDELLALTNSELPEIQALQAREPSGAPPQDFLFLFSFSKDATDEIQAAAKRPYSRFGSRADEDPSALLTQLGAVKRLCRAFVVKARVELLAGNTEVALSDWRTAMSLGKFLEGDPLLISLLVAIAISESPLQVVWDGLSRHQWSEEQLVEIQSMLESRNLIADAALALRGERNFTLRKMDQFLISGDPPVSRPPGRLQKILLPGMMARNKIAVCRIYSEHALPLLDTDRKRVRVSDLAQSEQDLLNTMSGFPPYTLLATGLVPAVTKSLGNVANVQSAVHLAAAACAIERHRLTEGKHPETLTELVPRFLDSIPADLDGQPLRYRLESEGSFVLYSIGIDLTDDKGRIGAEDGTFTTDEGDWVWTYPKVNAGG